MQNNNMSQRLINIAVGVIVGGALVAGGYWFGSMQQTSKYVFLQADQNTSQVSETKITEPAPTPMASVPETPKVEDNRIKFVTPVENEDLLGGENFTIIWTGNSSEKLTLQVVRQAEGGKTVKEVIRDIPANFGAPLQVVWTVPCDTNRVFGYRTFQFINTATGALVAESAPAIVSQANSTFCK